MTPCTYIREIPSVGTTCPYCEEQIPPHTEHIMWDCAAFEKHRGAAVPRPGSAMERRMGWSHRLAENDSQQNLFGTRVKQMAEIAKAER